MVFKTEMFHPNSIVFIMKFIPMEKSVSQFSIPQWKTHSTHNKNCQKNGTQS